MTLKSIDQPLLPQLFVYKRTISLDFSSQKWILYKNCVINIFFTWIRNGMIKMG